MYTRFYTDTIVTRFIKSFIANTYIPQVNVWKPGKFVMEGLFYITEGYIVKCNISGNPTSLTESLNGVRYFDIISLYIPGKRYYNINSNYISNISGYDPTTHNYLGNYLRYYRDYYNINLMPFYNCCTNEYVDNIDFVDVNGTYQVISSDDSRYKVLSVPVRFGQKYNIAIDCDTPLDMILCFYGPKGLLSDLTNGRNAEGNVLPGLLDLSSSIYKRVQASQFSSPFTYETPSWKVLQDANLARILQFERYLRLIIKIPVNNNSSIVVIEGDILNRPLTSVQYYKDGELVTYNIDYTSDSVTFTDFGSTCNTKDVTGISSPFGMVTVDRLTSRINISVPLESCLSPLGLLQMSDGNVYAFSDRLVEYLLLNCITSQETITDNIARIQTYASSSTNANRNLVLKYRESYTPGVWDDSLRSYLFGVMKTARIYTGKPQVDLTGYVDKDTEQIITRGQNS